MHKYAILLLVSGIALAQRPAEVGRAATPAEIKAWDTTILPDGKNLPPGQGNAAQGLEVYRSQCQGCHGADGKGATAEALAGGQGTLAMPKPVKTVGSYWPYATTIFDYVRRAMPYTKPGTLTDDQVYAVTAYILRVNSIIGQDDVMNAQTLPKVRMPNRDGFLMDPRAGAGRKKQ